MKAIKKEGKRERPEGQEALDVPIGGFIHALNSRPNLTDNGDGERERKTNIRVAKRVLDLKANRKLLSRRCAIA